MSQPPRPPISPRSILKTSPSATPTPTHAVHFPPSPSLTRIFFVHPPSVYDRSPIIVTPNSCALPERGCPGRTYVLDDPAPPVNASCNSRRQYNDRVLHPRALRNSSYRPLDGGISLPPLVPDTSSESEESDGFIGPLPEPKVTATSHSVYGLAIHQDKYTPIGLYDEENSAPVTPLSFLPHSSYSIYPSPSDASIPKPRRRRERKHDSSTDLGRIQCSSDGQEASLSSRSRAYLKYRAITSSFSSMNDEGCLGGF